MNPHLGKPQSIREAVAKASAITGIPPKHIYIVHNRAESHARFTAWAILRDMGKTWHQIARGFGVDHTSVIYGVNKYHERTSQSEAA